MNSATGLQKNTSSTNSDKWQLFGVVVIMLICSAILQVGNTCINVPPIVLVTMSESSQENFTQQYLFIQNTIQQEGLEGYIEVDSLNQIIIFYPNRNDLGLYLFRKICD